MKTFKDLEFEIINDGFVIGKKSTIHFDNGYEASVVSHTLSHGGKFGLYELAVLKDDEFHYDNPVAGGDVRGFLTEKDVTNLLIQIQNFK